MSCLICKKKIIIFKCKCEENFCSKHLLPEIHKCKAISLFKEDLWNKNKKILETNYIEVIKVEKI